MRGVTVKVRGLRRAWVIGGVATLAVAGTGVGVALASIPDSGTGTFTGCYGTKAAPVELPSPVRVLDTRDKTGGVTGPFTGTVTVPVTAAVPAGATEVLGTLTATQEKGVGYFTTWASGDRPTTSSLNYVAGVDVANAASIPLTSAGTFQLYSLKQSQAVFDVTGYVQNEPGAVRLIDPSAGQACAAGETETTWNQQGQAGPAGPAGTTGPAGSAGGTGAKGDPGDIGPQGIQGIQGTPGTPGPAGASASASTTAAPAANCPNGGTEIDTATGETTNPPAYACNGETGPAGADGVSGVAYEYSVAPMVASGADAEVYAGCPTGDKVLGGGFSTNTPMQVESEYPAESDTPYTEDPQLHPSGQDGWFVLVHNNTAYTQSASAFAICAETTS